MQKDFDGWNNRAIIETNRWGCSFYAGVCTLSQQRESWEVLSLTPIERPLGYSMTECSSKTKLESVENGAAALACPPKLQRRQAGGGSTVVSRRVLRTNLVSHSIDAGKLMSSGEEIGVVENSSLKPDRGIEPLGHKLTRLVPHHASGYGGFYHTLLITFLFPLILSTFYFIPTQTSAAARLQMPPNYLSIGTGLVGYWTFDGATTTWSSATAGITGDLSGNFNTGTLTNMNRATSPAIGKIGQGLKFDGSNDYVNVGAADVSVPCTMSAWVKLSARNGNTSPIFGTTGGSSYSGFQAEQYLSNAVGITVTGVQDYAFASPGYTVPLNTWTHLVAVVNSSASATLYVNGLTSGTISGASGLVCNRGRIGATAANFGYFPGIMDDVRIYNRALSAAEVLQPH